jgi:hypothetical protein
MEQPHTAIRKAIKYMESIPKLYRFSGYEHTLSELKIAHAECLKQNEEKRSYIMSLKSKLYRK